MPSGIPPFCMPEIGKSARLRHEAEAVTLLLDTEKSAEMTAGNQPAMIGCLGQRLEACFISKRGIDIVDETDAGIFHLQRAHMQHVAP